MSVRFSFGDLRGIKFPAKNLSLEKLKKYFRLEFEPDWFEDEETEENFELHEILKGGHLLHSVKKKLLDLI